MINGAAIPQSHELTTLHADLPPPVQEQLEATFQDNKQGLPGGYELIAFFTTRPSAPPPKMPPSLIGACSSFKNFFEYVDEAVKQSVNRYFYELVEPHQWRHGRSDLTLFMELIKHVLGNIERYIAPADSAEHGGNRDRGQGTQASKGEGTGHRKTDEDALIRAISSV